MTTAHDHYARLEDADLSARMSKDEEAKRLQKAQLRVLHLRLINGGQLTGGKLGPPVCIIFEGWDAAGKGGAIKRLVESLDPRHVHIAPFAAPTPDELRHHFLWRFWPPLPGWGGMTIFDRSWYGRVLVERVENLATEVQWRTRLRRDQRFRALARRRRHDRHQTLVAHVTRGAAAPIRTAARRPAQVLEADRGRLAEPGEAPPVRRRRLPDMLRLTDGPLAHWDVISSENKRNGRVEVIETVIRRMEEGMARWGVKVPSSDDEEEQRTEAALAFDDAEFQSDSEADVKGDDMAIARSPSAPSSIASTEGHESGAARVVAEGDTANAAPDVAAAQGPART